MKDDFVGKHRSTSDLKVHLVLTTKYRRKVFEGKMTERLHDIYVDLLTKWDCKLIEFNGEEDYVHLLFQYLPDIVLEQIGEQSQVGIFAANPSRIWGEA